MTSDNSFYVKLNFIPNNLFAATATGTGVPVSASPQMVVIVISIVVVFAWLGSCTLPLDANN